jgi:hypothetical protein
LKSGGFGQDTDNKPQSDGEDDSLPEYPQNKGQTKHMFQDRPGHVKDTPANSEMIRGDVREGNYKGTNQYGNKHYYSEQNGKQVWTEARNGLIRNCGVNRHPWAPGRIDDYIFGDLS